MKYSLLILQKEIPNLNGTDLGYYRTDWSRELEPLIILCCYNWWTRVLERGKTSKANNSVSVTTSTTNTSDVGNLTRELDDGNLRRELHHGNWQVSDLPGQKSNWNCLRSGPDLSRGVGPSRSEVKLELKKWPELLRIGLLKYPGGWSFRPILRFCFSRTYPPSIFSNFNKFHFLSV